MASRSRGWLRWLLLGVAAVSLWQLFGFLFSRRAGPDRLVNQVWIERMPRDTRDLIWHFVALDRDGVRIGTLGRSSRWRLTSDRFIYAAEGNQLRGRFPQNGCHLRLQARTWKCAGQAPAPFELCLELKSDKNVYRYYSRNDWAIRPAGTLDDDIAWMNAVLPALPAAEVATEAVPAADSPATAEPADEACAVLGQASPTAP
jgi:hypothetical protein